MGHPGEEVPRPGERSASGTYRLGEMDGRGKKWVLPRRKITGRRSPKGPRPN